MRQGSIESRKKSYVDNLGARKPLDFNLLRISPEFLIDHNIFTISGINCCAIFNDMAFNRSETRNQQNIP